VITLFNLGVITLTMIIRMMKMARIDQNSSQKLPEMAIKLVACPIFCTSSIVSVAQRLGGQEVGQHSGQALSLGELDRAQGQGRRARSQQGVDRRRSPRLRERKAVSVPARLQSEGERAKHY
jgi:hypothetical protein